MHITILSSSPRKGSNTLKVAKAIHSLCEEKEGHSAQLVNFEAYDLPMVGQGALNKAELSPFQQELVSAMDRARLIFLLAPEYNWITSGQLINAIHQLGTEDFAHLFDNKVFAAGGVSSGRGGRLPAIEMMTMINKMVNFLNKYSIVSPRLLESQETPKNLDEEGNFIGVEIYEKTLRSYVDYTLEIANRWFG